jgi:hypothetical protein
MIVDQAIFTSLDQDGTAGYHLAARSRGVTEPEAVAASTWSPSHEGLAIDPANSFSFQFFPLPSGRFAVARTCQGPPEYSGRAGRQIYTHIVIITRDQLLRADDSPIAIARDAFVLGRSVYQAEPKSTLDAVELSDHYPRRSESRVCDSAERADFPKLDQSIALLNAGKNVRLNYSGDRTLLVERILGLVKPDEIPHLSFSTSLVPSAIRPFRLILSPQQ